MSCCHSASRLVDTEKTLIQPDLESCASANVGLVVTYLRQCGVVRGKMWSVIKIRM